MATLGLYYVKNADTTEAYFDKSHLLRRCDLISFPTLTGVSFIRGEGFLKCYLDIYIKPFIDIFNVAYDL